MLQLHNIRILHRHVLLPSTFISRSGCGISPEMPDLDATESHDISVIDSGRMALNTLPNNGIESTMYKPPSIDHLFPDPDETIPVLLNIISAPSGNPRDNHWMLLWKIFNGQHLIIRRLQVVQEIGYDHLTNWGPLTVTADDITKSSPHLSLGELTLSQRRVLEGIAQETPVMVPNGEWNCQNWVIDVLKEAVKQNLLDNEIVDKVLIVASDIKAW